MQSPKTLSLGALLVAGILATVAGADAPQAGHGKAGTATYEVTFIPTWNPETHPVDYPLTHAKKGLLTPMVGATHGTKYEVVREGAMPTPGLEMLSEMGKQDGLAMEIEDAISAGLAGSLIRAEMGSPGPVHPAVSLQFDIDEAFPLVSLVGMIAPSPDWFYGVVDVDLGSKGEWLPQVTVTAYAWDSGGDAGMTYMAADQDLNPKEATRLSDAGNFLHDGARVPVGTFVFTRLPKTRS